MVIQCSGMMKGMKLHRIILISVMMLVTLCVYPAGRRGARYRGNNAVQHYFCVSADIAYAHEIAHGGEGIASADAMTYSTARSIIGSGMTEKGLAGNGFAPAAGVGYRLVYNHFLLDVGLGAEYRQAWLRPTALTQVYEQATDEQGYAYTGHHSWTARRSVMKHVGLNLPVMLGGEWEKFYFLAGVKLNADIWGRSSEQGYYSLEATYDRYMDPFTDMPNHGYVTNEPYTCDQVVLPMAVQLRACVEAGYCVYGADSGRYRRQKSTKVYVSVFGEYSVIGTPDTYMPLLIGARVTALIPLPQKTKCTTCVKD